MQLYPLLRCGIVNTNLDIEIQAGLLIFSTELASYITHQLTPVKENWSRVAKQGAECSQRSPLGHRKGAKSHPAPAAAPTGHRYGARGVIAGAGWWGSFGNFRGSGRGGGGGSRN